MTVLEQQSDGRMLLTGELSFTTVLTLLQQGLNYLKSHQQDCIFDLSAVSYSNSAGLALLMAWFRAAQQQQKRLTFVALPQQLMAMVKVTDLQEILPLQNKPLS
jgi:phospholipid transport system transporter-binding protein